MQTQFVVHMRGAHQIASGHKRCVWLIREDFEAGLAVFYRSTGSVMWPLVQSHDACIFHPIQAVTAEDGIGF